MTIPQQTAAWSLAPGELIALGEKASSHLGHPGVDVWWRDKTPDEQDDIILAGREALIARNPGDELKNALRVRREAIRLLVLETPSGGVVVLHESADEQVVLEEVDPDTFRVRLLLTNVENAADTLAAMIAGDFGGDILLIVVARTGGWRVRVTPGDGDLWRWVTDGGGAMVEGNDLWQAIAALLE